MIQIIEILEYKPEYLEATRKFLNQLTTVPMVLTEEAFKQTLTAENSHLFFIMHDEQIAGMLTVGIYYSPTGGKAWIEDVVIDEAFRGKGLSKPLVKHAIDFVKSQGVPSLMLTSNPKRVAANKLYQVMGFEQKETNVYRMKF